MIHNTPFGETLFFHAKFIKLTYSCEMQKTGRREDGNTCVNITQNKLSEWCINNEAVNMCGRPLPTNHSFCQRSRSNTNSHILHTYRQKVATRIGRQSVPVSLLSCFPALLLFFCFVPAFSSKACRCVAMRKKTGSSPPALVSM